MNKIKKVDSIIFDLDGTLWDATRSTHYVWKEALKNNNVDISTLTLERFQSWMGKKVDDIINEIAPTFTKEQIKKLMKEIEVGESKIIREKKGVVLYENVYETLKELSNKYKLFIVSNCQNGYIESFMYIYNLEKFITDFECPGRTNLSKAENIKLVIKRNDLKNAVYVGDTKTDFISANEAQIPFVYASYGFGVVKDSVYSIDGITDLKNILD